MPFQPGRHPVGQQAPSIGVFGKIVERERQPYIDKQAADPVGEDGLVLFQLAFGCQEQKFSGALAGYSRLAVIYDKGFHRAATKLEAFRFAMGIAEFDPQALRFQKCIGRAV